MSPTETEYGLVTPSDRSLKSFTGFRPVKLGKRSSMDTAHSVKIR